MKFKIGDKVKVDDLGVIVEGSVGVVIQIDDEGENDNPPYLVKGKDCYGDTEESWYPEKSLKKASRYKSPKFFLQYERAGYLEKLQEFQTLAEVKVRIKEFTKDADIDQSLYKVFAIAKTYEVSISKQVSLK